MDLNQQKFAKIQTNEERLFVQLGAAVPGVNVFSRDVSSRMA